MRKTLIGIAVVLVVLQALPARAGRVVRSGTHGFETIEKGVFDLGFDNMLMLRYHQLQAEPDAISTLNSIYFAGITPRYFIGSNFALGLSANWFIQKAVTKQGDVESGKVTDTGFIGFVMANYFIRLGNSLFFKPGIGGGGFWGSREIPVGATTVSKTSLYGGAARIDLGFAYYASAHFNIRAGFDLITRFGQEKEENADEGQTVITTDVGVSFGLGYSF